MLFQAWFLPWLIDFTAFCIRHEISVYKCKNKNDDDTGGSWSELFLDLDELFLYDLMQHIWND